VVPLSLINVSVVIAASLQMLERLHAPHAQLVLTPPGRVLLYAPLLMPLLARHALTEATLLLAPRGAPLAPVVPKKLLLEPVARSVLLVPSALHIVLVVARLAQLEPLPKLELILVPVAALASTLPEVFPAALLALWIPTLEIMAPQLAMPASLVMELQAKPELLSAVAVVLELPTTPAPSHALIAIPVTTKTAQARRPARNAPLEPLVIRQELRHAPLALLVNTNLFLVLRAAAFAPVAPSLLPARALAPFAPRANTLLLARLPVLVVLLDTLQTSLDPGLVLPALLVPNALALAAPVPRFALLAPSNPSLPRPPALSAPRKPPLSRLVLPSVPLALELLLLVLAFVPPAVGCCSPAWMSVFLSK
jgi:hypothetical protein